MGARISSSQNCGRTENKATNYEVKGSVEKKAKTTPNYGSEARDRDSLTTASGLSARQGSAEYKLVHHSWQL